MKTISELQQEIRSMQDELHHIDGRLAQLNEELLNYKDSGISGSIYKRIYEIAETMPAIDHPIINYNYAVKNNYFAVLVLVATCEDSINDEQLLFLQRMVMLDSQRTSIDLYMAGIGSVSSENVIFKIQERIKEELAYQLVLDMLIIANLSAVKTRKTFTLIADISSLFKIFGNELAHLSKVASVILRNKLDLEQEEMVQTAIKDNALYGYYLAEIPGWKDILSRRKEQSDSFLNRYVTAIMNNEVLPNEPSAKEEYGENWYYYE